MACADKALLLNAYVDGELDLVRSLEIEEHLKTCPGCAEQLAGDRRLRAELRSGNLYDRAPQGLEARIRTAVAGEGSAPPATRSASLATVRPIRRRPVLEWLAVAAAILIGVALGLKIIPGTHGNPRQDLVAEEAVASHIRSLQPGHLTDVESTDQHTVKPWFDGKLDYSPPVRDLVDQGFPLVGGRLDYVGNRNVAALVYQRRKHLINVFVWPESSGEVTDAPGFEKHRFIEGYNFLGWRNGDVYFCAVSDVSADDLHQLKELLDR